MTVPFPDAEPLPPMEDEQRERMIRKMEGDDTYFTGCVLSEADKHFAEDVEYLKRLDTIVSQFDQTWLNNQDLSWIMILKIRLKRFDDAFEIVENLFARKYPYGGLIAYSRLQEHEEPWLVEKRLEFLERAATAGLILAKNELNRLGTRKYGRLGGALHWIKSIPLIFNTIRFNSRHPNQTEGMQDKSKANYNHWYKQRRKLRLVASAKKHLPPLCEEPIQKPGYRPLPLGNNVDWKPTEVNAADTGASVAYSGTYPKADPWEQLSPEQAKRYMSRLQDGDISYAIDLAYDGAIYPDQGKAQMFARNEALSKLNKGQLDCGTLTAFAIIQLNLGLYDDAFQIIDELFARGYPDAGYSAYCTLKDASEPQIKAKGLEYLDRSARGGHVLALYVQTHIKYTKYNRFGRLLSARPRRKLRKYAMHMRKNDRCRVGYEPNVVRGYKLRYQKRGNLSGWME